MGMFDYITYKGKTYQTKNTPSQFLENYKIDQNNMLWHEACEYETVDNEEAFLGMQIITKNKEWAPCSMSGELYMVPDNDLESPAILALVWKGEIIRIEDVLDP